MAARINCLKSRRGVLYGGINFWSKGIKSRGVYSEFTYVYYENFTELFFVMKKKLFTVSNSL